MSVMALLLAAVHVQHGLKEAAHVNTSVVWAASAVVLLTPLETWIPLHETAAAFVWTACRWLRGGLCALIAWLFIYLAARRTESHWGIRAFLAIGFASVAMFFFYRAGLFVFVTPSSTLEGVSEGLAEFAIDAVLIDILLVLSITGSWMFRRRRQVS